MKQLCVLLCVLQIPLGAFAQGLVKFSNNSSTLVTYIPAVPPPPNIPTFYFALLTAPLGTVDPLAFTFVGLYATNSAAATGGRFQGGSNLGVTVAGWAAGTSRSFEVVGWSGTDGGPVWNPTWLTGTRPVYFGVSPIGQGFAGGTDTNGASIPPLAIFGAAPSLSTGFYVTALPEHGTVSLVGLAAVSFWFRNRQRLTV